MPILNYTTSIAPGKTVGEIQQILAKAGARQINIQYDDKGQPDAMSFTVPVGSLFVMFRLPCNWKGVLLRLRQEKVKRSLQTEEQARKVSWRIIKDWVEAQLAIIESGQAELAQVFLPYAVAGDGERTVYDDFKAQRLLSSGD